MKKIRIGMVGVTGRGHQLRWFHNPEIGSYVTAAMDSSPKALQRFRVRMPEGVRTTLDYDELLAGDDIDAVAITSPDFTHEEYVLKAFAAGKHVFCDKPMAITTKGCDRMMQAWKASGKHFMIGFNMRYISIFRVMKDLIDSGTIGELKAVWVRHFVGFGGDWYFHDWHGSRKNSTGLLLQKASHDIDMIHWITGAYTKRVSGMGSRVYYGGDKPDDLRCPECPEKDTCVEYYKADEGHGDERVNTMDCCVFRNEIDVEDQSVIMMELEGGIQATYMQNHFTPDYFRNYTFIGTEGRIENMDDYTKVVVKLRDRSNRWKNLADQIVEVKPLSGTHGGADPVICRDFIEMLQSDKKPVATPLAGRMAVAVACEATASIRDNSGLRDIPSIPQDLESFVY
jgi:predicted dehydrogenase